MTLKRTPITPDYFMTLALTGELDSASIPALCELTSHVLTEGSRHLIMDLSAVTRCDHASLYVLLGIRQAIHHTGGSLTLANPGPPVQDALSQSPLRGLLPLHDTLAEQRPTHESQRPDAHPDSSE
ncbi:STAS domain-containing protein [Streptomyces sp. NPDC048419]|uniref:STAS domain-containing protein n=1 Tax=Streptomyces sp. NPDC048419 TaxID=3365547 RepID=UPI0037103642